MIRATDIETGGTGRPDQWLTAHCAMEQWPPQPQAFATENVSGARDVGAEDAGCRGSVDRAGRALTRPDSLVRVDDPSGSRDQFPVLEAAE
ncbi:MAG: hypothetical protein AAFW88_07095 [Pseudomonadota bacterium]